MYKNIRETNQDLFRLILMFFVVVHHGIVHGLGLVNFSFDLPCDYNPLWLLLFNSFCVIAVNCFFLQSGYFGIRSSLRKFISICFDCVFCIILWYILLGLLDRSFFDETYFIRLTKSSLTFFDSHWYIFSYFVLFAFSKYINNVIERIENRDLSLLVIFLLVLNILFGFVFVHPEVGNGYTFNQAIMMYVIGFYCRKNKEQILQTTKFRLAVFAYVVLSLSIFALSYYLYLQGNLSLSWNTFNYNNPLIVASSITMFVGFLGIRIENVFLKKVSSLSKYSLFIIAFGDYYLARKYCWYLIQNKWLNINSILLVVLNIICLFMVCILVGLVCTGLYKTFERMVVNEKS